MSLPICIGRGPKKFKIQTNVNKTKLFETNFIYWEMQKKVYTVKKTSLTYVLEETTYTTMKIKLLRVIYTLWVLFPHWKLHFLTTSDNSMVIRLGFSRTFFILLHFVHLVFLLLHFVISGEEGKMLKSRNLNNQILIKLKN